MAIHEEVLSAALGLCLERGGWTFTPDAIVRALPHLNAGSIRTHVTSRCCVNAPRNHPHKWDYFRRVRRGTYELTPAYRRRATRSHSRARETRSTYREAAAPPAGARNVVHAFLSRNGGSYSADCVEVAVVTQGRTLDETVANLRDAIALHLEGEDAAALGLLEPLSLAVTLEEPLRYGAAASKA
jgi:predicted RNase H-like HicB family nuclease